MAKKKLKSYMVKMVAYCTILVVDAESEEKAHEYARDQVSNGDFNIDEIETDCVLKTPADIERCRRHADAIAEP